MNPLFDQCPAEVPLTRAPLDRAICQIRFPPIMSIGRDEFVASFQESLRQHYPLITQQMAQRMQFVLPGSDAPISMIPPTRSYRFSSADQNWHITLCQDFLAVETTRYTNRTEFLQRITDACRTLEMHIHPTHVTRLGVRYIDRFRDDALERIHEFFRPELLGPEVVPEFRANALQILSEGLFRTAEGFLVAKWGLLPENTTIDPTAILPEPKGSWILDLDAYSDYSDTPIPFDSASLVLGAEMLVKRIYSVFRWGVTAAFDLHFGRE
ncbi:MAG: TIGR04255 family protein [Thermodesulfobacteriota bacterium]